MSTAAYHRLAIAVTLATVVFLVLAIGALGIIGAGGRPDRIYATVLAVAVVGTVAARLQPRWMVWTLVATAFTQVVVTATALLAGLHHTEGASVVDILGVNALYVALFATAAWLFRRASAEERPAPQEVVPGRA